MGREPASARISPTAHYTGFVWYRHGLSPGRLATRRGRLMFHALQGPMAVAAASTGGLTLERMLLQRHLIIDHLLDRAIAEGKVRQVVEVAAGMSGRGHRYTSRHPDLTYVEADLPGMVRRKERALGPRAPKHHLVAMDALEARGPMSLAETVAPQLDQRKGCAIIAEGLLGYFDAAAVDGMWQRFGDLLGVHPRGLYLSDVHLAADAHAFRTVRLFRRLLGLFARGRIHLIADSKDELRQRLATRGFGAMRLHRPGHYADIPRLPRHGHDFVRVLEARTGAW